ncbi:MAG: hypothetical protein AAF525_22870 [Pseudomonadota bacterium]
MAICITWTSETHAVELLEPAQELPESCELILRYAGSTTENVHDRMARVLRTALDQGADVIVPDQQLTIFFLYRCGNWPPRVPDRMVIEESVASSWGLPACHTTRNCAGRAVDCATRHFHID